MPRMAMLLLPLLLVPLAALLPFPCNGGTTSSYVRRLAASADMPFDSDVFAVPPGYNAPQQVHITQGDHDGAAVIVSWVTPSAPGSGKVRYGTSEHELSNVAEGDVHRYKYYDYVSGFIHHCTIEGLQHGTKYYYSLGSGDAARLFWFHTPPAPGPDVPYTFGVIGDMGQTYDSNTTLAHYQSNAAAEGAGAVLYVGDLSYADKYPKHDNRRWDTWGRLAERSAAYQPWLWTVGNHEIDFAPDLGETEPFKPFTNRYRTPFPAAGSSSPYWYSVKRASAYIIVLSSYSAFTKYTPQYLWLNAELPKVDRRETPWLIVLTHAPLYSSYVTHYMEGEPMRAAFESWFVEHKVDIVFSGHVHAYERNHRTSNVEYNITNSKCTPVRNPSAPVYITIGDGGNIEGLATQMTQPQPAYSAFREASFGHGIFEIKNRTHARFTWHRNQDGAAVAADEAWITNRYWNPAADDDS